MHSFLFWRGILAGKFKKEFKVASLKLWSRSEARRSARRALMASYLNRMKRIYKWSFNRVLRWCFLHSVLSRCIPITNGTKWHFVMPFLEYRIEGEVLQKFFSQNACDPLSLRKFIIIPKGYTTHLAFCNRLLLPQGVTTNSTSISCGRALLALKILETVTKCMIGV